MFTSETIKSLFNELNDSLSKLNQIGEIYLVGGAVMCLAFNARQSTKDIDAIFAPSKTIRQISKQIALTRDLPENWLNDAVKGFLSDTGDFKQFLSLSNLKVYTPTTEYLFAMKCMAMRLGAEFHDEADVVFLIRALNIESYDDAVKIILKYYPEKHIPQKSFYALEEMINRNKIKS